MTDYTYPNISFNSKIIGPTPVTPPWRDGYAIVGDFNRGPSTPTKSNQVSVLAALYGEDKSSGSIALQQALFHGASNATIARVVPGTEPSTMFFQVAGDNSNIVPRTGYESNVANTPVLDSFNRTTGLALTIDYIGSPIFNNITYSSISTEQGLVTHPTFNGRARYNFALVDVKSGSSIEPVVYEDTSQSLSVTVHNTANDEYQIVSYTEGANAYVEQYLEAGFALKSSTYAHPNGLVIVSKPFIIDEPTGLMGVLVKGSFTPDTTIAGKVEAVTETKALKVNGLLKNNLAFTPTTDQLSILANSVALFGGQAFEINTASFASNSLTLTFDKTISGSAEVDMPVSFAPVVTGVALSGLDTLVTFGGLLASTINAGTKLTFSNDLETNYEVAAVTTPYNATAGTITVKIEGDVRLVSKVKSYALVTSDVTTATTLSVKVHFASKTQAIIGYAFQPVDSTASMTAVDTGRTYFRLPGSQYDSYFVLAEGSGGVPLEFFYQTSPNTITGAAKLGKESFGLKHIFGQEGDPKLYITSNMRWTVPFMKAKVTAGGVVGSDEAYPANTQANYILRDLENAIYDSPAMSSMFSDIKTDFSKTPYSFTGIPSFRGVEGNRIYWNLIRHVAGPTAVYSSNTLGVIVVESIPNVLTLNPTDYSLLFNGKEYPVLSFNAVAKSISVEVPTEDPTASFLELATPGETLYFVSQAQTRDLLMRIDEEELFSTANYGDDQNYSFIGGRNSAQYAFRDFYALDGTPLLRVQALSPGFYGNNLKVTILPDEVHEDTAKFYLQVEDTDPNVSIGTSKTETFYLSNNNVDVNTGLYLDTRESNLIRAYFIPTLEFVPSTTKSSLPKTIYQSLPLRVAPALETIDPVYNSGFTRVNAQGASVVKDVPLLKGAEFLDSDPPSAVRARINGYLNALRQIQSMDVTWIGIVGINYDDRDYKEVFDYAKEIVDGSNPTLGGYRRVVVQLGPNSSPRQAITLRAQADSPRFIQIAGVVQGTTPNRINYQQAASVGAYIGLGASRPPHVSPASVYGDRVPVGITYSNIPSNPQVLEAYTRANAEVIYRDDTIGAYKFLNGLTTSNQPALRYVSVVHTWDQVRDAIYKALLPYKSLPATPQLWGRIATACDALLAQFMRDEWLMRYVPTICDERNNTEADLIRGVVNILIQGTPSFPADYIKVTDVLDLRANISLNAQPGQSIEEF
jgi:hypothetical protein